MTTLPISVDFSIPNKGILNSNQRLHHAIKAKLTAAIRQTAYEASAGTLPMNYAHVTCWLTFGDKRRRDPGNWYPSAKAAIDGFIDAGVLPDDDHLHLLGPDMRISLPVGPRGFVGFHFTFTEVVR